MRPALPLCLALLAPLFACGPSSSTAQSPEDATTTTTTTATASAASTASTSTASPVTSESAAAATAATLPSKHRTRLMRGEGDVDGKPGLEQIELYDDGSLVAGEAQGTAAPPTGSRYFQDRQASLRAVEFDKSAGLHAVLVTFPTDEEEDPPNRYQLFLVRGASLERVFDSILGNYGITEVTFPGDGTMHYVEDGWTACAHVTVAQTTVPRHEVALAVVGNTMKETSRKVGRLKQACDQLAACPYVYVVNGEKETLAGEILRELRGKAAYTTQELALDPIPGERTLRVRVKEEKLETTHLDAIELDIDGVAQSPKACATADAPAYCVADGVPLLLRQGDALELEFDLPPSASEVRLRAQGYYVPTPTIHQR